MLKAVRTLVVAVLLLSTLAVVAPTGAHEDGEIIIYNVWARPAMHGGMGEGSMAEPSATAEAGMGEGMMGAGGIGAAYMTIENRGGHDIELVSVASPISKVVEIHEVIMENDVMKMQPIELLPIAEDDFAELKPGGFHLMLIDLMKPLEPGMAFPLTLTFNMGDHGTKDVTIAALVATEAPNSDIIVANAYATPPVEGATIGSIYMMLENRGTADDALVGASGDFAEAIELHETTMRGDTMSMNPVEALALPVGKRLTLESGGSHLMVINMDTEAAPAGGAVVLTLSFESGAEVTVAVPVLGEADGHDHDKEGGHSHGHGG
jgi:copper(I)-binding protein